MNKLIIIMAVLLSGCVPRANDANVDKEAYDPVVYIDRVTGCNYLSTFETKSLTPRIAGDGATHMGCHK